MQHEESVTHSDNEESDVVSTTSTVNSEVQNVAPDKISLTSALTDMESMFCLKLSAKYFLPIDVVNDIMEYSGVHRRWHKLKLKFQVNFVQRV